MSATTLTSSIALESTAAGAIVTTAAPDRLVSRTETCKRLGVTYPTIWAMMRDGAFPPGRYIGGRVFWRESEIEAFIRSLPRQARRGEARAVSFPGVEAATVKSVERRRARRLRPALLTP